MDGMINIIQLTLMFFFFKKQTHTQGRGEEVLAQRHTTRGRWEEYFTWNLTSWNSSYQKKKNSKSTFAIT